MTPFKNGNTITQNFGERPDYYAQFQLAGHEGLDMIPTDGDRTIYAVEDGEVVRDFDDPRSGAYGIYCVILNRQTKRAWWYCHESVNTVQGGQTFKRGDAIAVMGGTGNAQGDHLHLGLRMSDDNGNATNIDNGYKGFIDPKPVLDQLNNTQTDQQALIDSLRNDRDKNWNLYQDDEKQLTQLKQTIDNLNQIINDRNNDITQLNAKIGTLETQVTILQQQIQTLQDQANKVPGLSTQLDQALGDRDIYIKLNNAQKTKINELQGIIDKGKPTGFFNKLLFLIS